MICKAGDPCCSLLVSACSIHGQSNASLLQAQVAYAAQDAWLSRQLLLALFERHQRDTGGGGAADGNAHTEEAFRAFVAPFVDAHSSSLAQQQGHKQRQRSQQVAAGSHPSQAARQQGEGEVGVGNGAWSAQIRKPARHALRKKQLYENCRLMVSQPLLCQRWLWCDVWPACFTALFVGLMIVSRSIGCVCAAVSGLKHLFTHMQAPDGKVLCTCSTKKVLWWVRRHVLLCVEPWGCLGFFRFFALFFARPGFRSAAAVLFT